MPQYFFTLHLEKKDIDTVLDNREAIKAVNNTTLTEVLDECIDAAGGSCYQNNGSLSINFKVTKGYDQVDFSQFTDKSGVFSVMNQRKYWT
ncbi:hypothetical protein LMH73_023835 [Vibrio splendidus]|nr:hypothetical protein [Vibrio splendidus]MCC4883082.1 hypothetical protein [Vibrio splendidus]